jgi:hypothetical protein
MRAGLPQVWGEPVSMWGERDEEEVVRPKFVSQDSLALWVRL